MISAKRSQTGFVKGEAIQQPGFALSEILRIVKLASLLITHNVMSASKDLKLVQTSYVKETDLVDIIEFNWMWKQLPQW